MTASFDYSGLKTSATSLIARFGKPVVLSRASTELANLEVWEQSQGPTAEAQTISDVIGIQINLDRSALQEIERPLGQWVLQATSSIPDDVGTDWVLTADNADFQIVSLSPVKPGDTLLAYFCTVLL